MFAALGVVAGAVLMLVAVAPVAAQEAPAITVTSSFLPSAATVGERVTLEVRVAHPADVLVSMPRPTFPSTDFVSEQLPREEPQADGSLVTVFEWTFQPFTLRTLDSGPVPVRWLRADGSRGVVEGAPVALPITPTRAQGDETLRPLKPQASVPGAPPAWQRPALIAAAILVVAGALAGLAWWARGSRRRPAAVAATEHGPEERARSQLDEVRGLTLDGGEAFQRYYGTISLAVRGYLGERFAFNAAALTTAELERRMTGHGVDRWQARLVAGLLDRCDAAVYARRYPEPASADHDLTLAYEIVELGRPETGAATEEAAVPA
ncbi:MAG: hypothetical protein Q8M79_06490 [Dehalococcoidia bacterium]|nr:hypothetical protein [Dehalococcoidia bacterium]